MQVIEQPPSASRKQVLVGRYLTGFAVLFMTFDGVTKVVREPHSVQATTIQLGFPPSAVPWIGVLLLACAVVYLIPRTAPIGALLLTAYLGGAVAANVRVNDPAFETIFPILFAILIWAGLLLRDERLRRLLLRRTAAAR